jgi:hypothetical protein
LSSRLLSRNVKVKIYKTIILPVILYGCETWSLTLREEHRLRVFKNRVLRRIFGSKRNEVMGEWKNLKETKILKTRTFTTKLINDYEFQTENELAMIRAIKIRSNLPLSWEVKREGLMS